MNLHKDCTICVYEEVCEGRKNDVTITDCCVPAKALREMQRDALTADAYIKCTQVYIRTIKAASKYWAQFL